MAKKAVNLFIWTASALLVVTALAKVISGFGSAQILKNFDPVVGLRFNYLMIMAAVIELSVAGICLLSKNRILGAALIAWLSTSFLMYRIALYATGWQRPCPCLGNVTDAIHISPAVADETMKIVLAFLLLGSYAILAGWFWSFKRQRVIVEQQHVQPID
jgi:hypothetical protein